MKGDLAFDPASGAPLSETSSWHPDHGVRVRTPVEHPLAAGPWANREGALTNGEQRSEKAALQTYYKRVYSQAGADPKSVGRAHIAIGKIKAADDRAFDASVWLTLAERLAVRGFDVMWMREYCTPKCPRCSRESQYASTSDVKFPSNRYQEAVCASAPSEHGCVNEEIRERVAELYEDAFDEAFPDDPALV